MRLGVAAALVEGALLPGDVEVADGRVAAVGLGEPRGEKIAVPGFVDLQVNGYAGVDFSAPGEEGYAVAGAALLAAGVTAFQPTIVTAGLESMLDSLARVPTVDPGPRLIGAHLEGPFLSRDQAGAHRANAVLPPDPEALERLLAAGPVSQMTLAPELPGALALVDALVARGVTVSCGHTDANAAAAHLAFEHGAIAVTHVFNSMRSFRSRDAGIAFAGLGREDVFVSAIVDGHHLAPDTVRVLWRAAGDRLVLISDAVAAAAAPDGRYTLGGIVAIHSAEGVVRTDQGSLAGSTLSMAEAVRNAHALGMSPAAALTAATEAPARMARRPDLGRIEPGGRADIVVLDDTLRVERVLLGGEEPVARTG
ncbi:MAG TPA: amidohydrolase family protein [Solirubrobacterales bacterium]|nr:amidohydrolase family protein [Solirubrobacterales bacterium]